MSDEYSWKNVATVSFAILVVILAICATIFGACAVTTERDRQVKLDCAARGGTLIYSSCVFPRGDES